MLARERAVPHLYTGPVRGVRHHLLQFAPPARAARRDREAWRGQAALRREHPGRVLRGGSDPAQPSRSAGRGVGPALLCLEVIGVGRGACWGAGVHRAQGREMWLVERSLVEREESVGCAREGLSGARMGAGGIGEGIGLRRELLDRDLARGKKFSRAIGEEEQRRGGVLESGRIAEKRTRKGNCAPPVVCARLVRC